MTQVKCDVLGTETLIDSSTSGHSAVMCLSDGGCLNYTSQRNPTGQTEGLKCRPGQINRTSDPKQVSKINNNVLEKYKEH